MTSRSDSPPVSGCVPSAGSGRCVLLANRPARRGGSCHGLACPLPSRTGSPPGSGGTPRPPAAARAWWRCRRAFPAFWGVVVGPGDGVHGLGFVEVFRTGDGRDEADQVAVEQHLGLEARSSFQTPDGLPATTERNAYSIGAGARLVQVRIDAAIPERIGDPAGLVLFHAPQPTCASLGICASFPAASLRSE